MTFHDYAKRVLACFQWQWRWNSVCSDLEDKWAAVRQLFAWVALGIAGVALLVTLPLSLPLALLWQYCIKPFVVPLRLSDEQVERLRAALTPDLDDSL